MNFLCLRTLAACALAATLLAAQPAHAEDWEPTPDGAGVIDHDAGLVWGALNSSFGGSGSVAWATAEAGCRQYGLTAYNHTGQYTTGWRMPTLAEAQTAASHNAWYYFNVAWAEGNPVCWTSTKQSSSYWAIQFMTGATGLLNGKNGRADFRPVRVLEDWEYRPDLGGWLDHHTGLVWGRNSRDTGILFTWNGATNSAATYQAPGFPWRLPTLQEAQTAVSHNAFAYFSQNLNATDYLLNSEDFGMRFWTSAETGNKKNAWIVNFRLGETESIGKGSAINYIPVYRP